MLWQYYWWHDHYTGFWKPFLKLLLAAIYLSPLYLTLSVLANGLPLEGCFKIFGVLLFIFLWSSKGYYYCHIKSFQGPKFGPRASFQDFLLRWGITLVSAGVATIPVWIYLGSRMSFNPQGFWQSLSLFYVSLLFLGGFQLILLVIFIWFMFSVVWD